MRFLLGTLILGLTFFLFSNGGSAQDPPPITSANAKNQTAKKNKRNSKKDSILTSETDGTAALNRFKTETVIKSQYTQEGKPLEVDTD